MLPCRKRHTQIYMLQWRAQDGTGIATKSCFSLCQCGSGFVAKEFGCRCVFVDDHKNLLFFGAIDALFSTLNLSLPPGFKTKVSVQAGWSAPPTNPPLQPSEQPETRTITLPHHLNTAPPPSSPPPAARAHRGVRGGVGMGGVPFRGGRPPRAGRRRAPRPLRRGLHPGGPWQPKLQTERVFPYFLDEPVGLRSRSCDLLLLAAGLWRPPRARLNCGSFPRSVCVMHRLQPSRPVHLLLMFIILIFIMNIYY